MWLLWTVLAWSEPGATLCEQTALDGLAKVEKELFERYFPAEDWGFVLSDRTELTHAYLHFEVGQHVWTGLGGNPGVFQPHATGHPINLRIRPDTVGTVRCFFEATGPAGRYPLDPAREPGERQATLVVVAWEAATWDERITYLDLIGPNEVPSDARRKRLVRKADAAEHEIQLDSFESHLPPQFLRPASE